MRDLTLVHVAFTGKLQTMTRKQAVALAAACGAFPHDRLVETTQVIIAGVIRKPLGESLKTQKLDYAENFGLPIVNERDFLIWCQSQIEKHISNLN